MIETCEEGRVLITNPGIGKKKIGGLRTAVEFSDQKKKGRELPLEWIAHEDVREANKGITSSMMIEGR